MHGKLIQLVNSKCALIITLILRGYGLTLLNIAMYVLLEKNMHK